MKNSIKELEIIINNEPYKVNITKKKSNLNTYIRVKEDLNIYITTNIFTSDRKIISLIEENKSSIIRMLDSMKKKVKALDYFYYLGNRYDIVYTNDKDVFLGTNRVFIPKNFNIDKWYRIKASVLFKERLDYNFNKFTKVIPYPTLMIRKMKSRWGVCNITLKKVTLNLELMKKNVDCLDYVIVHELSHFIHPNHSREFWSLVEENYPNYKNIRKLMKEY